MKWLCDVILGPHLSWFTPVLILAAGVTCTGALPGAAKGLLAQAQMRKTLRSEYAEVSAIVRVLSEERDALLWLKREEYERSLL